MVSIRVRNANMSERRLKTLGDPTPSKLGVAGSNPAGVANFPTNAGFHSDKTRTNRGVKNRVRPLPPEARARHVYVIARKDGLCKVGVSRNAKRRLSGLQTGHPDQLILLHIERPVDVSAFDVEQGTLRILAPWRVGGEWFKCNPHIAVIALRAAHTGELRLAEFVRLMWRRDCAADAWTRAGRTVDRQARRSHDERLRAEVAHHQAWGAYKEIIAILSGRFHDLCKATSDWLAWETQHDAKWRDGVAPIMLFLALVACTPAAALDANGNPTIVERGR